MQAAKFTFDTVFRQELDVVSPAALARQKKTLTQAEIDALLLEARREGQRAGEVRAMEAIAAGAQAAAQNIENTLAAFAENLEAIRGQSLAIAIVAAQKLAGAALGAFPAPEVERVLREAMHQAIGEPRLTLRAAPAVIEALASRFPDIAHEEAFDGRVQASADPHLKGADCRIEWRGGGAERLTHTIEEALAALLDKRFAGRPAMEE